MTPTGTFERVYAAIRQRLRDGVYAPGDRLEPALLSDELNASVTPVRDALHRLTGERLVEAPRHEGFRAPMLTETALRHLYSWHLDLLLLAVARRPRSARTEDYAVEEAAGNAPVRDRQNALFAALARAGGNPEHVAALEAVRHRLEPVQRLEQLFLSETDGETGEILEALQAQDSKSLRRALVRYHRRRAKLVPDLLSALVEPRTGSP